MQEYQVRTPYRVASRQPVKVMHLVNIDSGVTYTPLCSSCDARLAVWVREGFITSAVIKHEGTCSWWIAGVALASAEMAEFCASVMSGASGASGPPEPWRPAA